MKPLKEENILIDDWRRKVEIDAENKIGIDWEIRRSPLFSKSAYDSIEPINIFFSEKLKKIPILWIHNQDDRQVPLPIVADFLAKCFDYFDTFNISIGNRGGHSFFKRNSDTKIYLFYINQISNFLNSDISNIINNGKIIDFNMEGDSFVETGIVDQSIQIKNFRNNPILKYSHDNSSLEIKEDDIEKFNVDQVFDMIDYMHSHQSHDRIAQHIKKELKVIKKEAEEENYEEEEVEELMAPYQKWIDGMKELE